MKYDDAKGDISTNKQVSLCELIESCPIHPTSLTFGTHFLSYELSVNHMSVPFG